jgi:hypothetical protein
MWKERERNGREQGRKRHDRPVWAKKSCEEEKRISSSRWKKKRRTSLHTIDVRIPHFIDLTTLA